jgi:hypothetical protein
MNITFQKFAGLLTIAAGICGLLYSLSFILLSRVSPELGLTTSAVLLMVGGLLTTAGMIALYQRLEDFDRGFALWALVLGLASALGATVHGAYDLANALHPPLENSASMANLPNQVDPRGLFTFGVAGLAVLVFSWLIIRSDALPRTFGNLGLLLGLLLIVIYLGRLIILDPTNAVNVVPALLVGFVVNPIWYIWLGIQLRR